MIWFWLSLASSADPFSGFPVGHCTCTSSRNICPCLCASFRKSRCSSCRTARPGPMPMTSRFHHAGLYLRGCYLHTNKPRKGIILFGLEFGSNRWSAVPYCEFLLKNGYDVFSFETRGQGQTPSQPGYEPMVWVTEYEADDFRAALAYLKERTDGDPRGVGFFGLSKGGSPVSTSPVTILSCAAASPTAFSRRTPPWSPTCRSGSTSTRIGPGCPRSCPPLITATWLTWVWTPRVGTGIAAFRIWNGASPTWLAAPAAHDQRRRRSLYQAGHDAIAVQLAGENKEIWIVDGAKHNQSINHAGAVYKERILAFFDKHLAGRGLPVASESEPAVPARGCSRPGKMINSE